MGEYSPVWGWGNRARTPACLGRGVASCLPHRCDSCEGCSRHNPPGRNPCQPRPHTGAEDSLYAPGGLRGRKTVRGSQTLHSTGPWLSGHSSRQAAGPGRLSLISRGQRGPIWDNRGSRMGQPFPDFRRFRRVRTGRRNGWGPGARDGAERSAGRGQRISGARSFSNSRCGQIQFLAQKVTSFKEKRSCRPRYSL